MFLLGDLNVDIFPPDKNNPANEEFINNIIVSS